MTTDGGRVSITASLPPIARGHPPPVLPFLLAYMSGLCGFFPATRYFIVPGLLPLGLFLFALFLTCRKTRELSRKSVIVIFLVGLGYLVPALPDLTRPSNHILNHIQEGQTTAVQGRLFSPPRVLEDRTYYLLELESLGTVPIPITGTVRVSVYKPHTIFKAGDQVRFNKIRLKIPRNFKNPGRFNYHLYLKSRGIDVTGNISRPETMERVGQFDLPFWNESIQQLRSRFVESLEKLFPGEEGALLKAMVLGMKDSLPMEIRENYIATGLAHLMAVSGLHIGFVAAMSYFFLMKIVFFALFRLNPDSVCAGHAKKITAVLCLISALLYMMVVGPKVSSLRAGIMVSAVLIAILFNRQGGLFNAFLTAGFIILLWKPESLLSAGFQLSFLAVGGILLVSARLFLISSGPVARMRESTWLQRLMLGYPPPLGTQESYWQTLKNRFEKILIGGALISATVTAVTFPVLVYQFNRVSLVGVFLNILMVPLASLLIPAVLLMTLVGTVSISLAALPAWPVMEIARFFLWLPEVFARFSFSSMYVPTPPSLWLVFYFSALFTGLLILCAQYKKVGGLLKKSFIVSALSALVLFSWPRAFQFPGDTLAINVLDVGQGESFFIEFPNGETLVMDGGGFYKSFFDVGKRVVAPFLWNRGIWKIDYMVATHSDNDHINGLYSLLDLFPVKYFLTLGENFVGQRLQNLQKKARGKGAEFIQLKVNKPISIGEVRLIPLHPSLGPDRLSKLNRRIGNDLSLVLRLEYKNFSMLFTGDIGEKIEKKLAKTPHQLEADILKGPHHGSRFSNSQDFINAVHPSAVIFSSGYLSHMSHPHTEVLHRYSESGVNIWRTDLNGAVKIITNGNSYEIHTHESL